MPEFPSFKQLVESASVNDLIKEHQKYLAHTPKEKLADHMILVSGYFLKITEAHGLEPLLDKLFLKISNGDTQSAFIIKRLFWDTILYHDFGKVNENFQKVKMGNPLFPLSRSNGIESQHSILSAYIFLIHQYSNKEVEQAACSNTKLLSLIAFFAHNIVRHHSSHLDDISDRKTFQKLTEELCSKLTSYLGIFNKEANSSNLTLHQLSSLLEFDLPFEWFLLIRLNFSLLTAADYYATSHYYGNWKIPYQEFGTFISEQKARHYQNLKTSHAHNKYLYEHHDIIQAINLDELKTKSPENLNRLRTKMAAEVLQNVRSYSSDRLFYIEAPTGGGKTNMAFIAAQELLIANPELNKAYYVFPFTTLITQTKQYAQETLGLLRDEFIELHSKAPLKEKEENEAEQDGLYGETQLDDIHNLFANYPYVFLSHIRFFDILKANDKSCIYLLHRLANSVVVIDEVQAYNPLLWDKMAYLLNEHAKNLNIRFVVMSATLPKIGDLTEAPFQYLLPDAINRFFTNPNFSERVTFNDELTKVSQTKKDAREDYLEVLANKIHDKAEAYRDKNGSVKIIVEFIFKKSTTEFLETAKVIFFDYIILVLSGTVLEPRRKEIINYLKSQKALGQNILLVTTQVVEAGVDIDMDLGFKNRSIIDSEEQLAGRVNRNVKKEDCAVYLFDLDDASVIYGEDLRYKEWKKGLEEDYLSILQTKRFDKVYDRIKIFLAETNKQKNMGGTLTLYKYKHENMNFPGVDEDFRLIEQKNTTVFVPLKLPLFLENTNEKEPLFTESQIRFLNERGMITENHISGVSVFDLYKKIVTSRGQNFSDKKREIQSIQAIMSLFSFSLFSESKLVKELENGGNPIEFGYLYLVTHKEVYDYTLGLLDKKFSNLIFL